MKQGLMTEKAFLETWEKFGAPDEITDAYVIHNFFDSLMRVTGGLYIVDNITLSNYDYVDSIIFDDPYTIIQWKNFDGFRLKYLNRELNADDTMTWQIFGFATYDYILCKISKLRFYEQNHHLYIGILSNLTDDKELKKWFNSKDYQLISTDVFENFEVIHSFWEGEPKECRKHICHVNSLPFYTILFQPKEKCCSPSISRKLLSIFTYEEVITRLKNAFDRLEKANPNDLDELFSIGNNVRRIFEYYCKYFCAYKNIDVNVTKKYANIMLGDLKKAINRSYPSLISQTLINIANDLSHDSGKIFSQSEIKKFVNDIYHLMTNMYNKTKE